MDKTSGKQITCPRAAYRRSKEIGVATRGIGYVGQAEPVETVSVLAFYEQHQPFSRACECRVKQFAREPCASGNDDKDDIELAALGLVNGQRIRKLERTLAINIRSEEHTSELQSPVHL